MQPPLTTEQLEKIKTTCQSVIDKNPKNKAAHHDLAVAEMQLGNYKEAVAGFRTARDLDSRFTSAWYLGGVCLAELGEFDDAVYWWQRVLELDKRHSDANYFIGKVYGMKGMWDMAIHQFNRAINLNDRSSLFYLGLAEMHLAKGDFKEAEKAWESALEIDPNNIQALTNISAIALELHDWEKAIVIAKRAIDLGATSSMVHYNMGMSCMAVGAYDLAIEYLEKACTFDSADTSNLLALGEAYVTKGELDKGIRCWESIIDQFPQHLDALYNLGLVYLHNQMGDRSREYFIRALAIDSTYLPARINLGIYYHMLGDLEASLIEWEEVLKVDHQHGQALGNIAEILLLQERYDQAEERLTHALSIYPDDSRLLFLKGWLAWELNRYQEVLASWHHARDGSAEVLQAYADRLRILLATNGFEQLSAIADKSTESLLDELHKVLSGEAEEMDKLKQQNDLKEKRTLLDRIRDIFK
ncbi:MAG: tetratricopeptide repeat protein [Symbiobacteriaceae bacterium]|nr:tetratricopeptide repeat protein [Symbiobacteriaceae bacterium]